MKANDAEVSRLRGETARAKAELEAVRVELQRAQSDVRNLQAALEQLEPAPGGAHRLLEEERLRREIEAFREERERLLVELRHSGAETAEDRARREKLVEFLAHALNEVERLESNGSGLRDGTAWDREAP